MFCKGGQFRTERTRMKKALAVLPLLMSLAMFAHSASLTFTYGPRDPSGTWAYLLKVNGKTVPSKTFYTYFTASEYTLAPGWSLYAPNLTLEGCTATYGPKVLDSKTNLYLQNDAVSCGGGWSGALQETYSYKIVRICGKYTCHNQTVYFSQGGGGALTR